MIFRSKSNIKNHATKRPLFSHRMVEDNAQKDNVQTKVVEPVQDDGLRLEPPTKREKPMSTRTNS